MECKNHGLLLQTIPYLGKGRILKIFSLEEGLLTLMVKRAHLGYVPFCIGEWVYKKNQREIFPLLDGSVTDPLLALKNSYHALEAAGSMAKDLLRSQLPGKPAPDLYRLICSYFQQIPSFSSPLALSASFRLKLLTHEGLLSLRASCLCGQGALYLSQGESFCEEHTPFPAIGFAPQEWSVLLDLAFAKQFSLLRQVDWVGALGEKIAALFEERLSH